MTESFFFTIRQWALKQSLITLAILHKNIGFFLLSNFDLQNFFLISQRVQIKSAKCLSWQYSFFKFSSNWKRFCTIISLWLGNEKLPSCSVKAFPIKSCTTVWKLFPSRLRQGIESIGFLRFSDNSHRICCASSLKKQSPDNKSIELNFIVAYLYRVK